MWAATEVHLSSMSCDGASDSTVELRTFCSALSRAALFSSITISTYLIQPSSFKIIGMSH